MATNLNDLINPQVMADMISAKVEDAIVVTPYAKIDNTLAGQPGNTITVPQYAYIGDASDVAEGGSITAATLSATAKTYTVKKAMQAVTLTDEAVLSGYGNPVGETNTQLAKAIASKIDADAIDALMESSKAHTAGAKISYNGIVECIDEFAEEMNTAKVMFINPAQLTTLRKDTSFISADKYTEGGVLYTGEVGMIANTRIVPSRRIKSISTSDGVYVHAASDASGAKKCVTEGSGASGALASDEILLSTVKAAKYFPADVKANDYVVKAGAAVYLCPIVKIEMDERTEDEIPALTIYTKRDVNVETERHTMSRTTDISVDKHYVVALTNVEKVVLGAFNA